MKEMKCEECNKGFKNHDALKMHNNSKHNVKNKKSSKTLVYIGIAAVLVLAAVLFFSMSKGDPAATSKSSDTLQKVNLGFSSNYNPNTIGVKAGIPVELTLDSSVSGCFRAFRIPALGVSKISTSPSDKITFTPDKPGIYRFQCGMNMGYGTLIVS